MSNNSNNDFSIADILSLDKIIHEPVRFAILSVLSVVEEADFLFIMNKLELTQGNLSSHLKKLEETGYIEIRKTYKGKRPLTIVKISETGRNEYIKYVNYLRNITDNLPYD
ncbi:MAG: hypothetical protein QG635_396 [Bacteroidota bacterium]|nr:hypothetical protein [Bacteroidota bacterium]